METAAQSTLKPLLVRQVTDDARALRGSDKNLQQITLSGLAVRDSFAGDTILKTNPSDVGYFVAQGDEEKINVDLITAPGCRRILPGTIINGPRYAVSGGLAGGETLGGFLYTFVTLNDGQLLWGRPSETPRPRGEANGGISYSPDVEVNVTREEGLVDKDPIRQVFWVHATDLSNTDAYTRIGEWSEVRQDYVWGDWTLLSGELLYIVVTDPMQREVLNPVPNAVYSVHTNISDFILPDAADLKYGTKITILQYPDEESGERDAWFTRISYTDPVEEKEYSTLCTPAPNRNTYSPDKAYLEGLSPTSYEFEVAPIVAETGEVIGKVWEIKLNSDETEFTSGLTEILSSHTDQGSSDFIDYLNLKYSEDGSAYVNSAKKTLVFNRSMPCSGYIHGKVEKRSASLFDNWTVVVKVVSAETEANFIKVNTTDSSKSGYSPYPSAGVLYFLRKRVTEDGVSKYVFELVNETSSGYEPGYLNPSVQFDRSKEYYTLDATAAMTTIATYKASEMTVGKVYKFSKYLNRHNVVYISIQPATGQDHRVIRNGQMASVAISVVPDPHRGAYLTKGNLNPSAYTQSQFKRLVERGDIVTDVIDEEGSVPDPSNVPVGSQALFNAYNNIAGKLQAKGLLYGLVNVQDLTGDKLDELTDTGFYRVKPAAVGGGAIVPNSTGIGGWPQGIVAGTYADVIVLGTQAAAKTMTHEEDAFAVTKDAVPDASKVYYTWNEYANEYELASGTGHPAAFEDNRGPFYEKVTMSYTLTPDTVVVEGKVYYRLNSVTGEYYIVTLTAGQPIAQPNYTIYEVKEVGITDTAHVTQIVIQGAMGASFWYRVKKNATNGWSVWCHSGYGDVCRRFTAASVNDITINTMLELGAPVLRVGDAATVNTVGVTLPAPTSVTQGRTIRIEHAGQAGSVLNIVVKGSGSSASHPSFRSVMGEAAYGDLNTIICRTDGTHWYFKQDLWALELNSLNGISY